MAENPADLPPELLQELDQTDADQQLFVDAFNRALEQRAQEIAGKTVWILTRIGTPGGGLFIGDAYKTLEQAKQAAVDKELVPAGTDWLDFEILGKVDMSSSDASNQVGTIRIYGKEVQ